MNKMDKLCTVLNTFSCLYTNYAKQNNMTYARLAILFAVLNNNGITQSEISSQWSLAKQTVNNEINNLVVEGSITLESSISDKRIKVIKARELGVIKYKKIVDNLSIIEERLFDIMSDEEFDSIINKFSIMRERLDLLLEEYK